MTAASVTIAAICIAITLFSITVAAVAVRMARKEIAHSRNLAAANRDLSRRLEFWTTPLPTGGAQGMMNALVNDAHNRQLNQGPLLRPAAPYEWEDGIDV